MKKKAWLIAFAVSLLFSKTYAQAPQTAPPPTGEAQTTLVHKALTQETDWLNTSRALQAADLRGRIVLVDFWTFCCINCIHTIPDLKALEKEFEKDLTVIGVHSAKFENEKDSENIRAAILRYEIEHPVVNDSDFKIWKNFRVNSWPTLILITPKGDIEQVYSGEGHLEELRTEIKKLRDQFGSSLNKTALPIALEKNKAPKRELSFPGKVIFASDFQGEPALFVSDSNHHRVLALRLDGKVAMSVGKKGESGRNDGSLEEARFNKPQGLLFKNNQLFVADNENHLLRKIDFNSKKVETLAGTGKQGNEREPKNSAALQTALSSPWDLAFYPSENEITIAMAGTHQLWTYSLLKKTVSILAGNGRESIDDGFYPQNSLSQPSGLAAHKGKLYFVDSETSSLRIFENGKVTTLIGSGLFDFGFKDGKKGTALMQHPLGVYADDSGVYIADSYNHSIRRYNPETEKLETVAGQAKRGSIDGSTTKALFNEPNAITRAGPNGSFYISDTNNHEIRIFDLATKTVQTMSASPTSKAVGKTEIKSFLPNLKKAQEARLAPGKTIRVHINLEPGWKINAEAPSSLALFEWDAEKKTGEHLITFDRAKLESKILELPHLIRGKRYRIQATLYYCKEEAGSACLIQSHDQLIHAVSNDNDLLEIDLKKP
jgi:thiol-disulfide isomerase/thioredoxin